MKKLLILLLLACLGAPAQAQVSLWNKPPRASSPIYTATTSFLAPAGSCTTGAVPFSFTGDPDTGMFNSAANAVGFCTGGTERWVINSSGAFNPATTNVNDIGNGTVNPRDVQASRSIIAGQAGYNTGSVKILGTTSGTATITSDATATKVTVDKPLEATTYNKVTVTAPATGSTLTISDGLTLTYAEGTWTPAFASLTVVGTPTYSGTYTKIGRLVLWTADIQATTSVESTAGTTAINNLPFTIGTTTSSVNCVIGASQVGTVAGQHSATTTIAWLPTFAASQRVYCSGIFHT